MREGEHKRSNAQEAKRVQWKEGRERIGSFPSPGIIQHKRTLILFSEKGRAYLCALAWTTFGFLPPPVGDFWGQQLSAHV